MFTRLRKVRYRLFSNHKIKNYLLYAVGEIILVVAGILIALQINTWNQNRKDRIEEQRILNRLSSDLAQDHLILGQTIEFFAANQQRSKLWIKGIIENNLTPDEFVALNKFFTWYGNSQKIRGTYNEIINSGQFALITNDSLKKVLERYYEREEVLADEVMKGQMENYIYPIYYSRLLPTREAAAILLQDTLDMEPIDLDALSRDREFHSAVLAKIAILERQLEHWREKQNQIQALIERVTSEIQSN